MGKKGITMKINVKNYDLSDEYNNGTRHFAIGGFVKSTEGIKLVDWLQKNKKELVIMSPEREGKLISGQSYKTYIRDRTKIEHPTSGWIDVSCWTGDIYADLEKVRKQMNGEFTIRGHFHQGTIDKYYLMKPKKIWFNGLNTTCEFLDGEKITVSPSDKDDYDKEVGVAMCIVKKMYGTRGKWLKAVESGDDQNVA